MSLILSFDIGYASIGWCVLSAKEKAPALPDILGTGAVTFPTDDCLASQRRDLRRSRRHIRSTRQRIERLKRWFVHMGILDRASLDRPGHAAPFLLAAAALQGHRTLDAWELWNVLRWYAHNRGYDGNSRWAKGEEAKEDTEKVQAAHALMLQHGTHSMCETVTACMGLKPAEHAKTISSFLPYKTLNAAYPRTTVTEEVRKLLNLHLGKIPKLDAEAVRYILKEAELTAGERAKLVEANIRHPKRYRCAASLSGVTDIALLFNVDEVTGGELLTSQMEKIVGDPNENYDEMRRFSPVYNADKIEVPIFLAHGEWDRVVDLDHLIRMKLALELEGASVQSTILSKMGHGFESRDSAVGYWLSLYEFLSKNLKQ